MSCRRRLSTASDSRDVEILLDNLFLLMRPALLAGTDLIATVG